jgi:Sec-independent protein secretion pathway component TatC
MMRRKELEMNTSSRDPRVLLSVLWIFVVLNFFARDIHELGRPGMLEQMMSGVIDGVEITEALMLLGGVMIEIPILMAVLALVLPRRINRWTNAGASLLTAAMIIAANLDPDLDNLYFMIIQLIALVIITRVAWCWSEYQLPDVSARS